MIRSGQVLYLVIPAKAGIHADSVPRSAAVWTPAFPGVTGWVGDLECAC
jgi:hypothetical protein